MARIGELARVVGAVAAFLCAAGVALFLLMTPAPEIAKAALPHAVAVQAHAIPKGAVSASVARELAREWESEIVTLRVSDERRFRRSRRAFGARVNVARLASQITQARQPGSSMTRAFVDSEVRGPLRLSMPFEMETQTLFDELTDLKERFDRQARSASADFLEERLIPHEDGRRLDVHATLDALHDAFASETPEVEAVIQERRAVLRADALDGLDLSARLGRYDTQYNGSGSARNRTHNLRVAAAKINGTIVMPGQTFDFNDVVGERNAVNGFRPAPSIAQGELVDGLGGGTCQIAGTLHAAVFFAGLRVVERHPHSRPSTYIFMGLDAAVSYPRLNFQFRNDFETPVALLMRVQAGRVVAEIRGQEQARLVTFVRRIDEITAYPEREVEDASLPRGVRVLRQRGVPGFEVQNWRIVRDIEARQALRTGYEDAYPPTTQIWRLGTGPALAEGATLPEGDTHGEYRADAYLSVSMGAGVRGRDVRRRAGRSGTPGWMARLGFPSADPNAGR